MSQTKYRFTPNTGIAGGLYDLTSYVNDSYNNSEKDGVLKHGMGVVTGDEPKTAALPTEGKTLLDFEGIVVNGLVTEHGLDGVVSIKNGQTVGILKQGRIWARIAETAEPERNKPVYLIVKGEQAGLFTTSDDEEESANAIAINAKFLTEKGIKYSTAEAENATANIAAVELYPTPIVAAPSAAAAAVSNDENGGEV